MLLAITVGRNLRLVQRGLMLVSLLYIRSAVQAEQEPNLGTKGSLASLRLNDLTNTRLMSG